MSTEAIGSLSERLRQQGHIIMPADEMEHMLQRVAKEGATHALQSVGLSGPKAGDDVRELLSLLEMWRNIRAGMGRAAGKLLLYVIVAVVVVVFGFKGSFPLKFP